MLFLENLKIETKFLVVPALVAVVTTVVLSVYFYTLSVNKGMLSHVSQHDLKKIDEVADLFSKISENHVQIFDLLALANQGMDQERLYTAGKEKLNLIHQFKADFEAVSNRYEFTANEKQLYADAKESLSSYLEDSISAIGIVTVDLQLAEYFLVEANKTYSRVNTSFLSLIDEERESVFTNIGLVVEAVGSRSLQLGVFLVLSSMSIVLITWAVSRSFSREIMKMIDILKRLAMGERTLEVPHKERKDEIGIMARATVVFKDTLSFLDESK